MVNPSHGHARNRLVTMLCRQHQRRFPLVVGQVHVLGGDAEAEAVARLRMEKWF
jgi:hypothetical protein